MTFFLLVFVHCDPLSFELPDHILSLDWMIILAALAEWEEPWMGVT